MKSTRILIVIFATILGVSLLACNHLKKLETVDSEIYGSWAGHSQFLDVALHQEYGTFPVVVEVRSDNTVTGTVGVASITDAKVVQRSNDYLIRGRLKGSVFKQGSLPREHKDCVIMLIELENGNFKDGNLHLKTNFTFDFSMRVCGLTLDRIP